VTNCSKEWASRYDVLMKKYMEECAERRSLHNELIELRGNIRVFCRCRPLNDKYISVVEIDPEKKNALQFTPVGKERKAFKFDYVFGPEDDQGIFVNSYKYCT